MAWTYILRCADGSLYVGSTTDLERRVWQHDNGEGAAYTRRPGRRPVTLAWAVEYERVEDAFAHEKQLQGWGRAKREALIAGRTEDLATLAKRPRARRRAETSD